MKTKIFLFIFFLSFVGCGLWNDFTTYFNLYYNTSLLFETAEEAILAERKDIFVLSEPNIPTTANQNLNKVIEKCSKILQFNYESSFVDEALLMTGKAFYYQKSYTKSVRKFNELRVKVPDSELIPEARLWIAKAEMQQKNFLVAANTLNELKSYAINNKEDKFYVSILIEETRLALFQKNNEDAVKACKELLNTRASSEILSQAAYQLGEIYFALGDYKNAAKAYKDVFLYSISFDVELNAEIKYAKSLSAIGEYEESFDIFNKLRSQEKNSASFAQIDFETALLYKAKGSYDEAFAKFKSIDTAFASSLYAGAARYELGELFEYHFLNYDSAYFYYSKASTSGSIPEYVQNIRTKNSTFSKFNLTRITLNGYLEQIYYAENPDAFTRDSIAFYSELERKKKLEENPFFQDEPDTTGTGVITELEDEGKGETGEDFPPKENNPQLVIKPNENPEILKLPPKKPTLSADTLHYFIAKYKYDLANLYFNEIKNYDSAYYYYNELTVKYSEQSIYPYVLYAFGTYFIEINKKDIADSLFNIIYENYKNEKIVNAAAEQLGRPKIVFDFDPAEDEYVAAESLMLQKEYNPAMNGFYSIFLKYPTSPFAPKSLYTYGYILENHLMKLDSAASIYDTLIANYPISIYANNVRGKVAEYKADVLLQRQLKQDSINAEKKKLEQLEQQKQKELEEKNQSNKKIDEEKKEVIEKNEIETEEEENPDSEKMKEEEKPELEFSMFDSKVFYNLFLKHKVNESVKCNFDWLNNYVA